MSIEKIIKNIPQSPSFHVTITGGEPLLQPGTPFLAQALLERNTRVLIFTNGSQSIGKLPKACIKVMDIKSPWCETDPPKTYPGFVKTPFLDYQNLNLLTKHDQVKFVIRNHAEFLWSLEFLKQNELDIPTDNIIFSPEASLMPPHTLGKWILDADQPIRLGIQVHKALKLDPGHGK